MKLRLAFWPILVVIGIPNAISLYWEPGAKSYPTKEACAARLEDLEKEARQDPDFLISMQMLNGGEAPEIRFSRECIDRPPQQYHHELMERADPGEPS